MLAGEEPVPRSVLRAFDLEGDAVPLAGGQGSSVRVGDAVLKPGCEAGMTAWLDEVGRRVAHEGFRLPMPRRARDGAWVVDGWSAFDHVPGEADPQGRWDEVLRAGRALHAALADEARPSLLDARRDRWSIADRAAWDGCDVTVGPASSPLLDQLRARCRRVELPVQVVHGDLSGNVLLADGLDPAIIDVSPYWRPVPYADAIVVVDAILWWDAHEPLIDEARPPGCDDTTWHQMLLRAAVFRLVSLDELDRGDDPDVRDQLPLYERLITLLEQRVDVIAGSSAQSPVSGRPARP